MEGWCLLKIKVRPYGRWGYAAVCVCSCGLEDGHNDDALWRGTLIDVKGKGKDDQRSSTRLAMQIMGLCSSLHLSGRLAGRSRHGL